MVAEDDSTVPHTCKLQRADLKGPHRRNTKGEVTVCHEGGGSPHPLLLHVLTSGTATQSSRSEETQTLSPGLQSRLCPVASGETGGRVSVPRPPDMSSELASAKYRFGFTDHGLVFRPCCGSRENAGDVATRLQRRAESAS